MNLLFTLILAHLLGDFLLQPTRWVQAKKKLKIKAWQLYCHALIHCGLILLLVGDWHFWPWAFLLAGIHLFIDGLKLSLQGYHSERSLFFLDQGAHFLSILGIWMLYEPLPVSLLLLDKGYWVLLLTAIFILTVPASITIKTFISKWDPDTEGTSEDALQNAGKYIGYLERLLIFIFLLTHHWDAVGFLLAAKSIFRFGDLKESRDRKLTEYVLIGTLLSFGIAIVVSILFIHLTN